MLRATRVLGAAAAKRTTGIVGLDVVPDARAVLIRLYEKTLNDIKASRSGGHPLGLAVLTAWHTPNWAGCSASHAAE
jgi:hypothetical protein